MKNEQVVPLTSTGYPSDYPLPVAKPLPLAAPLFLLRSHHDNLGDYMSATTATVNDDPSETQTQFTDECDIHKLLDRYVNGQAPQLRPVKYGETIDYTIGLQEALHAVGEMEAVHQETIPPELRNLYPTWREWINAAADGSYEHELKNLAEKKHNAEEKKAQFAEFEKSRMVPETDQQAGRQPVQKPENDPNLKKTNT